MPRAVFKPASAVSAASIGAIAHDIAHKAGEDCQIFGVTDSFGNESGAQPALDVAKKLARALRSAFSKGVLRTPSNTGGPGQSPWTSTTKFTPSSSKLE
jgi:hypothetical protein